MDTKICTFLLLLLGLAFPALSSKCPDYGRLPTSCKCKDGSGYNFGTELICSGSTLDELKDALQLLDTSSELEVRLDGMNLGSLPSRVFDGWNVVQVTITGGELDSLAPQGQVAFAGLEDKLENLAINSRFTEESHTKIDLSHLRKLTRVFFSLGFHRRSNVTTEVSNDWFARGPPSLSDLVFFNYKIVKIGDRVFANLNNLDSLLLNGNRFGPIKRSMLPRPANKLEHLELDNNGFTSIPDDLFADMPELEFLSIRLNKITSLSEKAFKPIWSQLTFFDVRGNPLVCDSSMEWMFDVKNEINILGTCEGPVGRKGMDLNDFIKNRGQ